MTTETDISADSDEEEQQNFALLIQQDGKTETTLAKFVTLLMSYRYGLTVETAGDFIQAATVIRRHGRRIRCVFVIQEKGISARTTVPALSLAGTIPLFLLFPGHVCNDMETAIDAMEGVHLCRWELAFASGDESLQRSIGEAMAGIDVSALVLEDGDLEKKVKDRLERLDTLPTLPAVVLHIMRIISDPKATMAQLEELLMRDSAIVLKVMQVANSPYFMGTSRAGQRWTLQEAVVRLGVKKVGAIAQQIVLINTFVSPEDSEFDIERFWQHSMATAMIADRLLEEEGVTPPEEIEFNDYWMAALLHDCGKVVQGFFFSDYFERILRTMDEKTDFSQAEEELGGAITHEWIGELLLKKSDMPTHITRAVGLHHTLGERTAPLTGLVHIADNMAKEMGLGLREEEPANYDRDVLKMFGMKRESARKVVSDLSSMVKTEVRRLLKECMG
ncbi:MAG: HDOD domain-containing protein [Gemmatimonadetes bacterium]|mgnify:CR=1 FL=1|jgi:HD-like signal output (HDOD) protein|nr:HDOD domain-containing protein [Gemmatimonadota bacterium]MBT4612845.1 HDOD domain-containing protein [Gemmatimonadota bacterium]MBT5057188.1 HDOD domain-containing protein [Gemmatimonadota bacterium]MBT5590745.1 HDOD domain-containing protein [Gemmatimonadota bacterium]MBT6629904.1 HDOD domain-containing protein [Gemmatimonadota bacterium]